MIEHEGAYDVITNVDEELLFCVRARAGVPVEPLLYYDGSGSAVLQRDKKRMIMLDSLPMNAKRLLRKVDKVLFAEILDRNLEREFLAEVVKVKELPK